MVKEINDTGSQMRSYICEKCGEEFTGFYGVSSIVYSFAKEHENNCKNK